MSHEPDFDLASDSDRNASGPHQNQPLSTTGAPPDDADAAVILLHGRGATAQGMIQIAEEINQSDVLYLAPQAAGHTWYPNSFLADIESNEPGLSSGLQVIENALTEVAEAGIPPEQTLLLGFSQGACLTAEFVARHARRYGGVAILSGGVICPDGTPRDYDGSLDGTPVFLGCSDDDPHIPLERVHETTNIFTDLAGDVDERIYEGMGHGVNDDELQAVAELVGRISS
jgi:phospholipase/carboxylesterase